MTDYRMFDTKRPDGCYVSFARFEADDNDASPTDYLDESDERVKSWRAGDWHFIGIQARADILIVRNGTATMHELRSPGLWAIESDSSAEYLTEVYGEEKAQLLDDLRAMGTPIVTES